MFGTRIYHAPYQDEPLLYSSNSKYNKPQCNCDGIIRNTVELCYSNKDLINQYNVIVLCKLPYDIPRMSKAEIRKLNKIDTRSGAVAIWDNRAVVFFKGPIRK